MRLLLAGASGFLGTAWRDHLAREGHHVTRLVRGEPMSADESRWDPHAGQVDQDVVEAADVVACLSGASLEHLPWTENYMRTFRASRVNTTRTLAEAIARSEAKPALLAQNGIAGYGDGGGRIVTEDAAFDADTFMGEVSRDWQAAARPAEDAGARVVYLRTGVVLGPGGGAFKPLALLFRTGLGGPIGDGQQYFSTISLHDWIRAATWLATSDDARGAYNVTGPMPLTNAEFTATLGRALKRPARIRVPGFVFRTVAKPVASEVLGSTRAVPHRLEEEGFVFEHRTQEDIITAALGR